MRASSTKPRPLLLPGDRVAVVAPGFAPRSEELLAGLRWLERAGFDVVRGAALDARHGYLAGTDEQRAADLDAMLRRPDIRAIWFARGGYGSARLLDLVDWSALRRRKRLLVGYSDVTALFCAALRWPSRVCLYGPVVTELGRRGTYHRDSLCSLLAGEPVTLRFSRGQVLSAGRARGRLLGGNLTVLSHLLGTAFAPRLRDAVLLLEDVGEETYRLDRLLTHLRSSGSLDGVRAVVLGSFEPTPTRRPFPPDRPLLDVVRETFLPLGVPVVTGLPVGHLPAKRTVPLGGRAALDTKGRTLTLWPRP